MAQDESESIADVLAALVAVGLESVGTKRGTIDSLPRDHATGNYSVPFLPASCSDAPNDDLCRSDAAQRRDEGEEAATGVSKLIRLSAKTSPQKLAAYVSGYEYPERIGFELVASAFCSNDSASKDIVLLRTSIIG